MSDIISSNNLTPGVSKGLNGAIGYDPFVSFPEGI